jgi:hypothetical protein
MYKKYFRDLQCCATGRFFYLNFELFDLIECPMSKICQSGMVSTSRASTFSRRYQQWYYEAIRSYQSYTPLVVVRSTCPRDGQPLLDDTVSRDHSFFPDIALEPVDFQGLDSRFSHSSVRTILTDMFHHPFRLLFFW